jgi:hypothetical protein
MKGGIILKARQPQKGWDEPKVWLTNPSIELKPVPLQFYATATGVDKEGKRQTYINHELSPNRAKAEKEAYAWAALNRLKLEGVYNSRPILRKKGLQPLSRHENY